MCAAHSRTSTRSSRSRLSALGRGRVGSARSSSAALSPPPSRRRPSLLALRVSLSLALNAARLSQKLTHVRVNACAQRAPRWRSTSRTPATRRPPRRRRTSYAFPRRCSTSWPPQRPPQPSRSSGSTHTRRLYALCTRTLPQHAPAPPPAHARVCHGVHGHRTQLVVGEERYSLGRMAVRCTAARAHGLARRTVG